MTEVIIREGTEAFIVKGVSSIIELVKKCSKNGLNVNQLVGLDLGRPVDFLHHVANNQITPPFQFDNKTNIVPNFSDNKMKTPLSNDGNTKMAQITIISENGTPYKIGYCLAYLFSNSLNHENLLLGPEIYTNDLTFGIIGTLSCYSDGQLLSENRYSTDEIIFPAIVEDAFENSYNLESGALYIQLLDMLELQELDYKKLPNRNSSNFIEIEIPQFGIHLKNPRKPIQKIDILSA